MKKSHIIVAVIILAAVGLTSYLLLRSPGYSAEDFQNEEEMVLFTPALPQAELDLRAQDLIDNEQPREGEPAEEAARDALQDYFRAGLFGEAWRIVWEIETYYLNDASYYELKGDLLSAMHQYKSAVEAYDRSLELNGGRGNIYAKLGDLYLFHAQGDDNKGHALALYTYARQHTEETE